MSTDVIEKVAKVLARADDPRTPEAERDTALRLAARIAADNSVDLALARQHVAHGQKVEEPTTKHISVGTAGKQLNATWCELAMAIGRANDLRFNIAHNNMYVIAFGFPSDIEMTEAMFAHLGVQMVDAANAYLETGDWKGEQVTVWNARRYEWVRKNVDRRVVKRRFYEGFIQQVGLRLLEGKREAERERVERDKRAAELSPVAAIAASVPELDENGEIEAGTSTEIVLRRKKEQVQDHYRKTSTARGSWKGGQHNTATSHRGAAAGRAAGQNARLTGQRSIGGPRTGIGR